MKTTQPKDLVREDWKLAPGGVSVDAGPARIRQDPTGESPDVVKARIRIASTAMTGYRLAMLVVGVERRRLDRSAGSRPPTTSPEEWALVVENAMAILAVTGDL